MDAFKRATLLTTQAQLGQITSDEVAVEMKKLMPLMQADPDAQPDPPPAAQDTPAQVYQQPSYLGTNYA